MEIRIAYSQRTEVEMLKKRREVFRMIALKCANFSIALAFTLCFASVLLAQPNKLYWSDAGTSLIQRSNLNGSTVEDVLMTDSPVALAFDLENGKMYWSNQVTDDAAGKLYYIVDGQQSAVRLGAFEARLADVKGLA